MATASPFFRASAKRQAPPVARSRARRVRRRVNPASAAVIRFPYHFADQPLKKFVKLRYVVHEPVTAPAVNSIAVKEYRANGMYDPEFALGGHQPYGFDQLMAQYNHFTVLKSTFNVEVMNANFADNFYITTALTADSGTLAAAYAAGGAGAAGCNALRELPITSRTLAVNTYGQDVRGSHRNTQLRFDAARYFGKRAYDLIGDSRFQGDVGADPPEQAFFGMALYNPTGATVAHEYPITVTITYYACFTEPKWFTTS